MDSKNKIVFNINDVMKKLKEENRIFCSEADFQHTIAWTIKKMYESIIKKIYLEYPFIKEQEKQDINEMQEEHNHLDILIIFNDDKLIPIELKYKTTYPGANGDKKGKLYKNDEENIKFKVRNQGAKNYGCYNYIKDISRIESFKSDEMFKENFKEGYAIFLTNDSSYWEEVEILDEEGRPKFDYSLFSINHNRKGVNGKLNWKYPEKHKKSKDGKPLFPPIKVNGYYDFYWKTYYSSCKEYKSKDDFGKFKCLITTIK